MIRTVLTAAMFLPFAAQAQTTGKWEVKVAPAECSLIRTVTGPAPALLAIRTVTGTDQYVVLASGKEVPVGNKPFPATLGFDAAKPAPTNATPAGRLAAGPAVQFFELKPSVLDDFAAAKSVAMGTGAGSFARFDLPNARGAIGALRKCVADQLVDWGADPAQFAPGGTPPVALKPSDDWLTNEQMLKLGVGVSGGIDYLYRVTVSTSGTVESCKRDTAGPGDKDEKLGCDPLIGQKLFKPAKNAAGAPVKGVATFRVTLVKQAMVEGPSAPPAPIR
jgi:hypothetical protein